MSVVKFGVGQAVKRVEDVRLVSGRGFYTSDYAPEDALHAVFVRSPHAHAKFTVADLATARATPGVIGAFAAADFAALGPIPCLAPVANSDGSSTPTKPYPVMAADEVFHVGDIVAMVVAETLAAARDGAEAVAIDYESLPAVVDSEAAILPGAPELFAGAPGNVAYDAHVGDKAKTEAAFAKADRVVAIKVINQRVVANYMEPRGAVATYDAASDRLTFHHGGQGVHLPHETLTQKILKIPPEKLRVVTADVGGGFGIRALMYREYPLVLEVARRLKRAVRWQADRTEHFVGDAHGRDNVTTAEMALDRNGRFLAMRVDILGNLGGYVTQFAPYIPWLGASMATGAYAIDALYARVRESTPTPCPSTPIAAPGDPRRPSFSSGWSTAARARWA